MKFFEKKIIFLDAAYFLFDETYHKGFELYVYDKLWTLNEPIRYPENLFKICQSWI